jgi:single stranded DNA-binding protein
MQENRFQLAGYLAAKPTLRYLPSSMPVANARLGQTYRFSRQDKPSEHTNWFSLVFYGDLAILATELEKGTNLYVEGTFDQRPYVGQDQYKRYIYEVSVHKFFVIGGVAHDPSTSPPAHAKFTDEVMTDGAPVLESAKSSDTWLL